MAPQTRLRVAICGGGICGLTLAVALSKYADVQVDVYEAAARFREIGAGVMIWSRTWRILELLGLSEKFSKIAHAPPDGSTGVGFDYRRSDRPQEGFRFHLVEMRYGCIRFHRAEFLDVLVDALPSGVAHFGKRLSSYSRHGPAGEQVQLHFQDGAEALCDVLVGCDGVKSVIRAQMYEEKAVAGNPDLRRYIEPVWTGTIAYRGLIPVDQLTDKSSGAKHRTIDTPMMYCGPGKHVVSYAISAGSIVNVVTFASQPEKEGTDYDGPWVIDCTREELLECYGNWEPEVERLLQCIDSPTKWAIHHLRPLPSYVEGRVALLGDAAHAMAPHQGAGAGQAIEDAFVLASLLGDSGTTRNDVDAALAAYEHVRLPLANHVLEGSQTSGAMYEFNDDRYGADYERLGPAIERQWRWVTATTPEDELRGAHEFCQSRRDGTRPKL